MSVLRSKRKIAKTEFENTFSNLYQYSVSHTSHIPKRRRKWLCVNIDDTMNILYRNLMDINDTYFRTKDEHYTYIKTTVIESIKHLNSLEKSLMVLWNVQEYEIKAMSQWVIKIRQEVDLLNYMHDDKNITCEISILDRQAINNAIFLRNMSVLHRYTHGKVVNASTKYNSTHASLLISLVDDAFYELICANKKFPTNKLECEERKNHISNAIKFLKEMNRPMLFYFNIMDYSEKIMIEWSELLADELKMLIALQKSDKKRFCNFI